MSFGGSVQAMITSLKRNARERKSTFESLQKRRFSSDGVSLDSKSLSEEELQKIKKEIQKEAYQRKKRNLFISLISLIITLLIPFLLYVLAIFN